MTGPFKKQPTPVDAKPIGYTIPAAIQMSGIGRTALYGAMRAGDIKAKKAGRHVIVLADSLEAYVRALPAATFKATECAG